jgi:hypothetical protein
MPLDERNRLVSRVRRAKAPVMVQESLFDPTPPEAVNLIAVWLKRSEASLRLAATFDARLMVGAAHQARRQAVNEMASAEEISAYLDMVELACQDDGGVTFDAQNLGAMG